jgi:tetratricopeptide (TPR) repeat protein
VWYDTGVKRALLLPAFLILLSAGACAAEAVPSEEEARRLAELESLHKRADELVVVNDFRGAIRLYMDAVLLEPDDAVAYVNMGRAYWLLGDTGRARTAFENALSIEPDNEAAHEGLRRLRDPDA